MAPVIQQIHEPELIGISSGRGCWLEDTASPLEESADLFESVWWDGMSVEAVRELIFVPANIEAALRQYARRHPEDADGIERVLDFRKEVGAQFERLLRDRNAWTALTD